MRILYLVHVFYPEGFGGTEKFVFNIASYAKSHNNDIKIITYSNYEDKFYDKSFKNILYREFEYKGLNVLAFKLNYNLLPNNYDFCNCDIENFAEMIISDYKPNVVHLGHVCKVAEFAFIAEKMSIPYIITLTDFYLMCPNGKLLTSSLRMCDGKTQRNECNRFCPCIYEKTSERYESASRILKNAKYAFSPSDFLAKMFEKQFDGLKVYVNNHGINYSKIITNERVYEDGDKLTFAYAGGTSYIKGLHLILRALSYLKNYDFNFKIYGVKDDDVSLMLIEKYKLKNVEICGVFDEKDVGSILSKIDLLIVPSIWYENYPLILHESLACGIPVITSNIGGMAEKIKNCINGFTFDLGDVKQLKGIIELVIDNPHIINNLKRKIQLSPEKSIEDEANEYLEIYEKISSNYALENFDKGISSGLIDEWEEFNKYIMSKGNVESEHLERMKIRVFFLKQNTQNKKINYLIWGASNSGRITKIIFDRFLPNLKLIGVIDKYKVGSFEGVKIYKPSELNNISADYYVVSTTIGKKEAVENLKSNGLELCNDIILGYGL